MRNGTRKRSRLNADIEPIHVSELLNGAGMTGFLSVLAPPSSAPHLKELAEEPAARQSQAAGTEADRWVGAVPSELALRLSVQTDLLVRQLASQQETLLGIAEVARRLTGGAERLQRQTAVVKRRVVRERLRRYFEERSWRR